MASNPPLRKSMVMFVFLLVWMYGGRAWFGVHSPYMPWFDAQEPATKVWVGVWLGFAVLVLSDALFLLWHGTFGSGRVR